MALFNSPIYTEGLRPEGGAGEAAYWLPLLALFTGARIGELAQLHVDDIKEQEGITFLHITNEGEGQNLKTESSRRRVPLHPELVKYGFLQYVQQMKERKSKRLFPGLNVDAWGKWYGRYARRVVGIKNPKKTFHSFRHAFKDACGECDIDRDKNDALTGHKDTSVSGGYLSGFSLNTLARALDKLRYPGLDLSHLYLSSPSPSP